MFGRCYMHLFLVFARVQCQPSCKPLSRSLLQASHKSRLGQERAAQAQLDIIEIVTATDARFTSIVAVMLTSLHRHHQPGEVRVTILADSLNAEAQKDLNAKIRSCCSNLEVRLVSQSSANISTYRGLAHISSATMLRLALPMALPHTSRVIWLDGDVVVRTSLRSLWEGAECYGSWNTTDSSGICARSTNSQCSAVTQSNIKYRDATDQSLLVKTFNAGVMLMDLDILRLHSFADKMKKLLMVSNIHDQQALNIYAQGAYAELNPHYNAFPTHNEPDHLDKLYIAHFVGSRKPWTCGSKVGINRTELWYEYSGPFPCVEPINLAESQEQRRLQSTPATATDTGGLQWSWNARNDSDDHILVVWSSVADIPDSIVEHARRLIQLHANRTVYGLCAAPQCMRRLHELGVVADLIRINFLVHDARMRHWFANSILHKVLYGKDFEEHFHRAVVLNALYQYGGLYVDLKAAGFLVPFPQAAFQGVWAMGPEEGGPWFLCRLPKQSKEAFQMMVAFATMYGQRTAKGQRIDDDFYSQVQKHAAFSAKGFEIDSIVARGETGAGTANYKTQFGILKLDIRAQWLEKAGDHAVNLGDEMQGFPGLQFLPHVDFFVDRDDLGGFRGSTGSTLVFLNAWYGTPSMTWPPSSKLDPVLTSIHVEGAVEEIMSTKSSLAYLKNHGAVGARDTSTLELFKSWGVPTELSACMTLLLQGLPWIRRFSETYEPIAGSHRIYIVDVPADVLLDFPQWVRDNAERLTAHYVGKDRFGAGNRFWKSFELLERLRSARLVITSRLHSALPSVAMGIPTIFVKHKRLPGGYEASHDRVDASLMSLFHVVDLTDVKSNHTTMLSRFDFSYPPRNPGEKNLQRFRAALFRRICAKPYLADYYKMFAEEHIINEMSQVEGCND